MEVASLFLVATSQFNWTYVQVCVGCVMRCMCVFLCVIVHVCNLCMSGLVFMFIIKRGGGGGGLSSCFIIPYTLVQKLSLSIIHILEVSCCTYVIAVLTCHLWCPFNVYITKEITRGKQPCSKWQILLEL